MGEMASFQSFEEFCLGYELGSGATSIVYKALHKPSNLDCCVKILQNLETHVFEIASQEYKILKGIQHPNICKGFKQFKFEAKICIILEFCSGGSLSEDIEKRKFYDENRAFDITNQIISALHYLHSVGVAHRDLNPKNLLFSDFEKTNVKLIDFGFSCEKGNSFQTCSKIGILEYMAPELFCNEEFKGCLLDVWSLGCVLYFMLFGKSPFHYCRNNTDLALAIMSVKFNFKDSEIIISKECQKFIKKCLCKQHKRPSMEELIHDSWLTIFNFPLLSSSSSSLSSISSSSYSSSSSSLSSPSSFSTSDVLPYT